MSGQSEVLDDRQLHTQRDKGEYLNCRNHEIQRILIDFTIYDINKWQKVERGGGRTAILYVREGVDLIGGDLAIPQVVHWCRARIIHNFQRKPRYI